MTIFYSFTKTVQALIGPKPVKVITIMTLINLVYFNWMKPCVTNKLSLRNVKRNTPSDQEKKRPCSTSILFLVTTLHLNNCKE